MMVELQAWKIFENSKWRPYETFSMSIIIIIITGRFNVA